MESVNTDAVVVRGYCLTLNLTQVSVHHDLRMRCHERRQEEEADVNHDERHQLLMLRMFQIAKCDSISGLKNRGKQHVVCRRLQIVSSAFRENI